MGLVPINLKTVSTDCENVLLDPLDTVDVSFWNKVVENGAVAYYQPHKCIAENTYNKTITPVIKSFWGCIPPSNPACSSSYSEKAFAWISLEVGRNLGDCIANWYGGTDPTSLSLLGGNTFTASGTYDGYVNANIAVPYYNNPSGSANPYYIRVDLSTSAAGNWDIKNLDVYYRKWIDLPMPYIGQASTSWTTATGWRGTSSGTEGDGGVISFIYSETNITSPTIGTTSFPSGKEYVIFGASTGTGGLYTTYAGDNWPPDANKQYTRYSSTINYFIGSADSGTLTTEYYGFFKGVGGENKIWIDLWNSSGTTKCKIYGHMFTAGVAGTTFDVGSWVGAGTEGYVPMLISGIHDNDAGTNYMSFAFSISAYSATDFTVSLDLTDYGAELWDMYKLNFYTTHASCNIGICDIWAQWTL